MEGGRGSAGRAGGAGGPVSGGDDGRPVGGGPPPRAAEGHGARQAGEGGHHQGPAGVWFSAVFTLKITTFFGSFV